MSDEEQPQPPRTSSRPTVRLDVTEISKGAPSWPLVLMSLERLAPWARYAFRLGILALLQGAIKDMTATNANPELVNRARELVEALAHLPWETDEG